MTDIVQVQRHAFWVDVTISDVATRNAMTGGLVERLIEILTGLEDDRQMRAIVLRGAPGIFCAGADLKGLAEVHGSEIVPEAQNPAWLANRRGGHLYGRLAKQPQVVIAAIDGAAMGGGFGLACCADIVIGTGRARFALSETKLGLVPAQIAPFVIAKLGFSAAKRLALTAVRLDATAAHEVGLVDQLVATDVEMEAAVASTLEAIRQCAPDALGATKALLINCIMPVQADYAEVAASAFLRCATSPEGAEGIAAFLEKRSPEWSARA